MNLSTTIGSEPAQNAVIKIPVVFNVVLGWQNVNLKLPSLGAINFTRQFEVQIKDWNLRNCRMDRLQSEKWFDWKSCDPKSNGFWGCCHDNMVIVCLSIEMLWPGSLFQWFLQLVDKHVHILPFFLRQKNAEWNPCFVWTNSKVFNMLCRVKSKTSF